MTCLLNTVNINTVLHFKVQYMFMKIISNYCNRFLYWFTSIYWYCWNL